MKKLRYLFILIGFLSFSQSQENEKANYDLAYKFSPKNIIKNLDLELLHLKW